MNLKEKLEKILNDCTFACRQPSNDAKSSRLALETIRDDLQELLESEFEEYNTEGCGEMNDKVRCVQCGDFVDYEDAYVDSVEPDEDGYETIENCICKWCKEENKY